jgi:hypothetical protein
MTKPTKAKSIVEFRRKHIGQLEDNMRVAKSIRDGEALKNVKCAHCKESFPIAWISAKEKIDAIKRINDMLGIKSEAKTPTAPRKEDKPALKPKHQALLDKITRNE